MKFDCPKAAAMPSLPVADACPFKFDQILREAYQRVQPTATPPFTTEAPITSKAAWLAMIAALDGKKIVVSPVFAGMVIPGSEGIFTGGNDNTTPFGVEEYGGEGAVRVDYLFTNLSPKMVAGLRKFSQESIPLLGSYALSKYLFTKDGGIVYNIPRGAAQTTGFGIPILNQRYGTMSSEGLNTNNKNGASFSLPPEWDETIAMAFPEDWNPLTDL